MRLRKRRLVLPIVALLLLIVYANINTAQVVGESMEPRYQSGDRLIVLKTFRWLSPLKPGDVVILHLKHSTIKGEDLVKRVVFVQNNTTNAPWPKSLPLFRGDVPAAMWFGEYVSGRVIVPHGHIMVMGDNIGNSTDSRDFGPVADYEVTGKVLNP